MTPDWTSERLVHVEITHVEDVVQRWVRFGRPSAERTRTAPDLAEPRTRRV